MIDQSPGIALEPFIESSRLPEKRDEFQFEFLLKALVWHPVILRVFTGPPDYQAFTVRGGDKITTVYLNDAIKFKDYVSLAAHEAVHAMRSWGDTAYQRWLALIGDTAAQDAALEGLRKAGLVPSWFGDRDRQLEEMLARSIEIIIQNYEVAYHNFCNPNSVPTPLVPIPWLTDDQCRRIGMDFVRMTEMNIGWLAAFFDHEFIRNVVEPAMEVSRGK